MKDYKLSKIKTICEGHDNCEDCEFSVKWVRLVDGNVFYHCSAQLDSEPYNWDIDETTDDDEIKNKMFVELPCKIGDKVYFIEKQGMDVYTVKETRIINLWFNIADNKLYPISTDGIPLNEIFFDQAEAEKRLFKR